MDGNGVLVFCSSKVGCERLAVTVADGFSACKTVCSCQPLLLPASKRRKGGADAAYCLFQPCRSSSKNIATLLVGRRTLWIVSSRLREPLIRR